MWGGGTGQPSVNNPTLNTLGIGGLLRSTSADFYTGAMDEVRIYNHALSSTEVTDLYNAVVPEPGSVLLLIGGAALVASRRRRTA